MSVAADAFALIWARGLNGLLIIFNTADGDFDDGDHHLLLSHNIKRGLLNLYGKAEDSQDLIWQSLRAWKNYTDDRFLSSHNLSGWRHQKFTPFLRVFCRPHINLTKN